MSASFVLSAAVGFGTIVPAMLIMKQQSNMSKENIASTAFYAAILGASSACLSQGAVIGVGLAALYYVKETDYISHSANLYWIDKKLGDYPDVKKCVDGCRNTIANLL